MEPACRLNKVLGRFDSVAPFLSKKKKKNTTEKPIDLNKKMFVIEFRWKSLVARPSVSPIVGLESEFGFTPVAFITNYRLVRAVTQVVI